MLCPCPPQWVEEIAVDVQGFASELLGELFTKGKGPFGQIGVPLGQPLNSEYAGVALAAWVSTQLLVLSISDPFHMPSAIANTNTFYRQLLS